MKSLANCKPSEFLQQTNRIRKSVAKWLTDTDVINIIRRIPEYETAPKGATAEERKAVIERNAAKQRKQAVANMNATLNAMLEEHPDETLEMLALCCFVEPDHVDDYSIKDYITTFTELISDEVVLNFFTSLTRLVQTNTLNASEA